MSGQKIFCFFLIAILYGVIAQDANEENSNGYDIGCYERHDKFLEGDLLQALRNGELLPSCVEGGLWRPVQCGIYNCSCVYVDTGNAIPSINTTNASMEEIARICPNRSEEVVDSCVRAPLTYPCGLNTIKYRYNNDNQRCEEVSFDCYGFDTRSFCEEICETQEIEVDIEVQFRYRFRVRIPRWVASRYDLVPDVINELKTQQFIELTNQTLSVRLIEEITTTTTASTTTTTTTTTSSTTDNTPMEVVARMQGIPQEICKLPEIRGPCRGYFPRWYFDSSVSRCRRFTYGGCLPNGNNFVVHTECGRYCGAANRPTEEDLGFQLSG